MNVNLKFLEKDLVGTSVPKPISGTLSGHAAGEPFDKHVFKFIKVHYPKETYRQYEFLNKIYLENRASLLPSKSLEFLLHRGKKATKNWSKTAQFTEKQDDTADILLVHNNFFNLIDVKTYNIAKKGQPPNIISAYKLAKMCALMLENKDFNSHDITYIGISWEANKNNLVCNSVSIKELFKTDPSNLYINWAAAMQIQFHVEKLDQSYKGKVEDWCKDYLKKFVKCSKKRSEYMVAKFANPFEKYLK